MLAKCVLLAPPRGGKKNKRSSATFLLERISRWEAGHRSSLWEEAQTRKAGTHKQETEKARLQRAVALCREGFDRKACAALVSDGLLPANAANAKALQDLHPTHADPNCPDISTLPQAYDIDVETLERVLRSFPPDSAPGPSALRIQHILEALTPACRESVLGQLLGAVNFMARGQFYAKIISDPRSSFSKNLENFEI